LPKTDFIIREMHTYHDRFESLMEEFKEHVPKNLEFGVGHFKTKYKVLAHV